MKDYVHKIDPNNVVQKFNQKSYGCSVNVLNLKATSFEATVLVLKAVRMLSRPEERPRKPLVVFKKDLPMVFYQYHLLVIQLTEDFHGGSGNWLQIFKVFSIEYMTFCSAYVESRSN